MPRKKQAPNHGNYYEVKITYQDPMTGTRKRKSFLSSTSKEDARRKADAWKAELLRGPIPVPLTDSITLEEWAAHWLKLYKSSRSASTYNGYAEAIRNEIIPFFRGLPLSEVYPATIQAFYNSLPPDRSSSWMHKRYLALSGLLKSAVDNGLIYKSPHDGISPPKGRPTPPKRTYAADDRDRLFAAATADPEGLPVAILLELGLRREELLGLRWEDVDLLHKTITICRTVKLDKSGGYYIGETKNKSSRRQLPLSDSFAAYLSRYQSSGYVVPAPLGNYWNPHNWSKRRYFPFMERVCSSLGLPVLNPHELRHTCGTLLYNRTSNLFAVSRFLGHASTAITAAVYVHSNAESLRNDIYGTPKKAAETSAEPTKEQSKIS